MSDEASPGAKSPPSEQSKQPENEPRSLIGVMRGCMNPVLEIVRTGQLRRAKHARKILRPQGHKRGAHRKGARVCFRLPKSKTVRVVQPFEADSTFVRRWRHFMAGPMCYEMWAFPFRLAFGTTGLHSIIVADITCDILFLISAAIKCATVVPPGTLPDQTEPIRGFSGIVGLYMRRHFIVEFVPMILYYVVTFAVEEGGTLSASVGLWWLATAPRMLVRGRGLWGYFSDMSNDLQVSARLLESVKFALIIILSSHWAGCIFYWLSRIMAHDEATWVHEFQTLLPLFDKEGSPLTTKYLLCLYKGFNSFSNLGYDYGIPRNWVDLVYSIFVMAAQVYLSALILGTLLNYLVRNNPAEEQHKQLLIALAAHVEDKNIPPELRDRMFRHFNFQHKKNMGRNAEMLWFLPKSLTVKVAYHKYQVTINKCALEGNAFHGCDQGFLDDFLARLKVMHFAPGELLTKKGDLPRELYMVVEGALVMMDEDNRVLTVIRSDVPDMPPYANIAPFIVGVHNPHPLIASLDGECTALILTKEDADLLFHAFPAEHERVLENVLATYGLHPDAKDAPLSKEKSKELFENAEWVDMRSQVREALQSQRLQMLADYQDAVARADHRGVLQLIAKRMDPNQKNYDGRTGLHIASSMGHCKVVETLLDARADANAEDRWGRTPLLEAVYHGQRAIVGLLEQREAEVTTTYLTEKLRLHAAKGRVGKVRQLLEVGGFDVNAANYDGRTALHLACANGQEEVVDQLVRSNADVNAKDRFGGTPLKDCVVGHHSLLATILRTKGGLLPAGLGAELICTAAGEGDIQTLKLLFDSHENMNTGDYDARCALHLAAAEARILAVSFLLTHTADPNSEDRWAGRPMDDALRGGTLYHMYSAKLIESWGGKPSTLGDDEEKLEMLEGVSIKDGLGLVQRLTALGFDKKRVERVGEQELLASFESCLGVVPLVATIKGHAEVLANCVEEASESVSACCCEILDVIEAVAKRLSPNAGMVAVGSVRDLQKMTRLKLWEKVRLAKESRLLQHIARESHRRPQPSSRHIAAPPAPSNSPPPPGSMGSPLPATNSNGRTRHPRGGARDESASLAIRTQQLRESMARVHEAEDDENGAEDFSFYACVNGIESDEEEALFEELDRIEAQSDMLDESGLTVQAKNQTSCAHKRSIYYACTPCPGPDTYGNNKKIFVSL